MDFYRTELGGDVNSGVMNIFNIVSYNVSYRT